METVGLLEASGRYSNWPERWAYVRPDARETLSPHVLPTWLMRRALGNPIVTNENVNPAMFVSVRRNGISHTGFTSSRPCF